VPCHAALLGTTAANSVGEYWRPGPFRTGALCFRRPGRPVENGFESFDGRLRDECLKVQFTGSSVANAIEVALHYNEQRSHSSLADRTPASFACQFTAVVERSAPMSVDRTSERPGQGFASPAHAALDPAFRLSEDGTYRGEAPYQIRGASTSSKGHSQGSLIWKIVVV
jgi:Integrase core domain